MKLTKTDEKLLDKLHDIVYNRKNKQLSMTSSPDRVAVIDSDFSSRRTVYAAYGKCWYCLTDGHQDLTGCLRGYNIEIYTAIYAFSEFKFITKREYRRLSDILQESDREDVLRGKIEVAKELLQGAGYDVIERTMQK